MADKKKKGRKRARAVPPEALEPPPPAVTPRMAGFFERALGALRKAYPTHTFLPDLDRFQIGIQLPDAPDEEQAFVNLENIYKVEREAAIARSRGDRNEADPVADLVRSIALLKGPDDNPSKKELLELSKPVLIPPGSYDGANLVTRALRTSSFEMGFALDYGAGIRWIMHEHLEAAGLSLDELEQAALGNLETGKERELAVFGDTPEEGEQADPLFAVVESRDGLASSRVFDRRLGEALEHLFPNGYRVAIPKRDLLLAFSAKRLSDCTDALAHAREDYATASHPLSPDLHAPREFQPRGQKGPKKG